MKPPSATAPPIIVPGTPEVATQPGPAGYAEFEIDIEKILKQALPVSFEKFSPAPLTSEAVAMLPRGAKGAYLLLHDGQTVYAGKTDTRHGFRDRLGKHAASVQHRVGLAPEKMSFKAVRILVFSNFDVEAILIAQMRAANKQALPWNDSGFGSNDPGQRRDGQKPAKFDEWFPIDIDRALGLSLTNASVAEALNAAKSAAPYLLRFEDHEELQTPLPAFTSDHLSMRDILKASIDTLPPSWQATVLHGRVILYRKRLEYDYMKEAFRRDS